MMKTKKLVFRYPFYNKDTLIDYSINQDSLKFSSLDNKNSYEGSIEFKPFILMQILIMKV